MPWGGREYPYPVPEQVPGLGGEPSVPGTPRLLPVQVLAYPFSPEKVGSLDPKVRVLGWGFKGSGFWLQGLGFLCSFRAYDLCVNPEL